MRKGKEARLSFMGHALMENGNGLLMDFVVSRATGRAEREAVPVMLDYRTSQKVRKQMEEIFGWMKTVGGFRRTRYRGVERTGLAGYFVATAYNLVRMANLVSCQRAQAVHSV